MMIRPPSLLLAVHGDLKPGNVLLKTHKVDRRGYIAKVGGRAFGWVGAAMGDF